MSSNEYRYEIQRTYRYLRLALIMLVALLGAAVGLQVVTDGGDLQQSISAYYYTPARSVFVASLCAIGACMIVHRGRSDLEDVLLNSSGFLAFFVAFVPTRPEPECPGAGVPLDVVEAITNNTRAILVTSLVAFGVAMFLVPREERSVDTRSSKLALMASVAVYLALAMFFLVWPDTFVCYGHNTAAIALFVGVVGVVGVNGVALARKTAAGGKPWYLRALNRYGIGFLVMLGSIVVVLLIGPVTQLVDQWVFWLEFVLIAQFASFWITQTAERWSEPEPVPLGLYPG